MAANAKAANAKNAKAVAAAAKTTNAAKVTQSVAVIPKKLQVLQTHLKAEKKLNPAQKTAANINREYLVRGTHIFL